MTGMLSPQTCVAPSIATPIMMSSYLKPSSASSPVFAGPISAPKILVSFLSTTMKDGLTFIWKVVWEHLVYLSPTLLLSTNLYTSDCLCYDSWVFGRICSSKSQ